MWFMSRRNMLSISPTKASLIIAAERLFALNSIAGTSLRQIGEAANQKNSAAVHYHFESREGIITAIVDYRMGNIDLYRHQMLDRLLERSNPPDMRDLLSVLVKPAAQELQDREEGNYYFRFLQQLFRLPELLEEFLSPHTTAWRKTVDIMRDCLRWLPPPLLAARLDSVGTQNIFWLASIESDLEAGRIKAGQIDFRVECVVDAMLASLIGPVGTKTLAAAANAQILLQPSPLS
jgi:AcrR family transcriptional regulator